MKVRFQRLYYSISYDHEEITQIKNELTIRVVIQGHNDIVQTSADNVCDQRLKAGADCEDDWGRGQISWGRTTREGFEVGRN
jgi:hypothetical protein